MKNDRQSNIELLRIIAMIFIIFSHLFSHSNITFQEFSIGEVYLHFLQVLGKIGVNIFVLISGFFLIDKNNIDKKKIIRFWINIFVYSICLYAILTPIYIKEFRFTIFIKNFMPITAKCWWFASTYFILYIFSPYLNRLINSFSKEEFIKVLVFLSIVWCLIPTLTQKDLECNNLLWFIYLYMIAAFYKKYQHKKHIFNTKLLVGITIIIFTCFIVLITFCDYNGYNYALMFGLQRVPTLIASCLLFVVFNRIQIKNNQLINKIAKTTFGIYLIHDHYIMQNILWTRIIDIRRIYENNSILVFIVYSLVITAIVFIVCSIIESIRIIIESLLERTIVNKIYDKKSI